MVQSHGHPYPTPIHLSTSARIQQSHSESLSFPRHSFRSAHHHLLPLHPSDPGCCRHHESSRRVLFPAYDFWAGNIIFGRGEKVGSQEVASGINGQVGLVIVKSYPLRRCWLN